MNFFWRIFFCRICLTDFFDEFLFFRGCFWTLIFLPLQALGSEYLVTYISSINVVYVNVYPLSLQMLCCFFTCPSRYLFDEDTLRCQRESRVNCRKFTFRNNFLANLIHWFFTYISDINVVFSVVFTNVVLFFQVP